MSKRFFWSGVAVFLASALVACGGGNAELGTTSNASATSALTTSVDSASLDRAAQLNTNELNRAAAAEKSALAQTGSGTGAPTGAAKITAGTVVPVYRFYIPARSVHFLTANEAEKQVIQSTMTSTHVYEGIAFYASSTPATGLSPVYRYYNPSYYATHFYSISEDEQAYIDTHYLFNHEGIAFYASKTAGSGLIAVNRFQHRQYGNHLFTPNAAETQYIRDNMASLYNYEGVAFYALDPSYFSSIVATATD